MELEFSETAVVTGERALTRVIAEQVGALSRGGQSREADHGAE
jgi:hypothetical protein